MNLILIRHGIAEDAAPGQADAERHLTQQGRHRLRDALPGLRRLLAGQSTLVIWTSPKSRAAETAEILARGLSNRPVQVVPSLVSGDLTAFLATLAELPEKTSLIAVGHEPTLSLWSQDLCGTWLPFRKGAAAAIDISSFQPLNGQLLWFMQPRSLRQLK